MAHEVWKSDGGLILAGTLTCDLSEQDAVEMAEQSHDLVEVVPTFDDAQVRYHPQGPNLAKVEIFGRSHE